MNISAKAPNLWINIAKTLIHEISMRIWSFFLLSAIAKKIKTLTIT